MLSSLPDDETTPTLSGPRRAEFSQWLYVVIGDEAGFSLNASVNSHKIRAYHLREQPLNFQCLRNDDRHKLTVWVGLMGNGTVIGPFFFLTEH